MNVETGEIKEFDDRYKLQAAMATGKWIELERRPNPKCKRCYGRGHTGYDTVLKRYLLCRCVKKMANVKPLQ